MRKLNIVEYCDLPANKCERGRECKKRDICDGYNACGNLQSYDEEGELVFGFQHKFHRCGDCQQRFYICPHLILKGE